MHSNILVIGGGIVGCSIAYEAAKRGMAVTLLEREEIGREASWAAGGILTPIHLAEYPPSLTQLCSASQKLYPAFVREIHEVSGIDPEFHETGVLVLIMNDEEQADAENLERWKHDHGQPVVRLRPEEAWQKEPAISHTIRGALYLPDICQVRNNRLTRAIAAAAQKQGAVLMTHTPVLGLHREGDRVTSIETPSRHLRAGTVVIASGCWSPELSRTLGWTLPVSPVRGQMLLTESVPPLVKTMIMSKDQYLVPRRDGKLLIGSTVENVGYDSKVTREGVEFLKRRAADMVPALSATPILQSWAGLRPATPDRLPYVGPVPELGNVLVATGHYRNGILLAPITARLIAELLSGEIPSLPLDAFRLDR